MTWWRWVEPLMVGVLVAFACRWIETRHLRCVAGHDWEPRAATAWNHKQGRAYDGSWVREWTETKVLHVCRRCGRSRVEQLVGEWTIAQLNRRVPAKELVDDLLREKP